MRDHSLGDPNATNAASTLYTVANWRTVMAVYRSIGSIGFALAAAAMTSMVPAQVRDFGSRVPSQEELVRALAPADTDQGTEGPAYRTRGIRPAKSVADMPRTSTAVSMALPFGYDSSQLSGSSTQALNSLGGALTDQRLEGRRFLIEGHTDSAGSAAYNQGLSERRAESVRRYLVANFKIPADRLETAGLGENAPLPGRNPADAANRRVQIINLGE